MPPLIKKKKPKFVGELRRSQTLTTYGCGAIVDFPKFSGIMAGLDAWKIDSLPEDVKASAKIRERNLEKMLGKDFFYQFASTEQDLTKSFALPTYRFPEWYYCPECHRLDYYYNIAKDASWNMNKNMSSLVCNTCVKNGKPVTLIPSRFVVACLNGHINEFPYIFWAHRNKKEGVCNNPKLTLTYQGTTGGLDSIHIKCETCGAENTMAGCMSQNALKGLHCFGTMPWFGKEKNHWYTDPETCGAELRVLQRSANNVYYSVNQSALTIPPWSEKLQEIIVANQEKFKMIFEEDDQAIRGRFLKREFENHPDLYGKNYEAFLSAIKMVFNEDEEEITEHGLRLDEYNSFIGKEVDDPYFRTKSEPVPALVKDYVRQVKLVKKLREVMVLRGFRRILPSVDINEAQKKEMGLFNREFTPISKAPLNWLPAIELFGEGVFIELNEEKVLQWEQENEHRYAIMGKKLDMPWIGKEMFDAKHPRFVLLHTLAHLLIRQLTAQCGYATASIKEKIYSSYPGSDQSMCGILIYTSASDTDGSLGGLVREGRCDRLETTFENMLQESSWCSNDPLCIDSISQGFKGLNYAACHACTLLPETSCEAFNCLLDRAAIVGTPDHPEIAFFKEIL